MKTDLLGVPSAELLAELERRRKIEEKAAEAAYKASLVEVYCPACDGFGHHVNNDYRRTAEGDFYSLCSLCQGAKIIKARKV